MNQGQPQENIQKAEDQPPGHAAIGAGATGGFLGQPLEALLTAGGDPRLFVNPEDGLNGYGCAPAPRGEALSFSSTTASSITEAGYIHAAAARLDLSNGIVSFHDAVERMRGMLKKHLLIDLEKADVVFSPSGTDGQVLALFMARAQLGMRLTSIVVGAGETGSGTAFTAKGQHFNIRTAQGAVVEKGAGISGLHDGTASFDISLRDEAGGLRPAAEVDKAVMTAVEKAVGAGGKVMLQTMDSSKLGARAPSAACLREITARWPDDVMVLIDACQMRFGRARLKNYLRRGYLVLITGSKFFAGPPFSGAVLVPENISRRLQALETLPQGLADYAARDDFPAAWKVLRKQLPPRKNLGQWLRWEAALEEMRLYFAVPAEKRRAALNDFAETVARCLDKAPSLSLLPAPPIDKTDDLDDGEMAARTVFPFFVRRDGKNAGVADCKKIYQALNRDMSAFLPPPARKSEKKLAACLCHIGQPVPLGTAAVLRLAAGARTVYGGFKAEEVQTVVDKVELLVKYFDTLPAYDEKPAAEKTTPLRLAAKENDSEEADQKHIGQERIGMVKLTRMAYGNIPLQPLWDDLFRQVEKNPADAAAMMDMADIAQILGQHAGGLIVQSGALGMARVYRLPCAVAAPRLRVLMLAAPVEMGGNTPVEFLLEGSDIALSTLYIVPGLPLPDPLPPHDIAFNAIGDTEESRPSLEIVKNLIPRWPVPVLNAPAGICRLNRDALHLLLKDVPKLFIPMTSRISRAALEALGRDDVPLEKHLADGVWPLIVRPIDSYAGRGLDKLDGAADIGRYLAARQEEMFFISRYIDYSAADGAFRKYRVVFIDGAPYAVHMAISHQWKIWYLNADMAESSEKRAEEDDFMTHFDDGFGARHKDALMEISSRVGLSYFAIDCAETKEGDLLIFEGGNTMIIHNMDPAPVYPYKVPQMKKIYQAFTEMIGKYADKSKGKK